MMMELAVPEPAEEATQLQVCLRKRGARHLERSWVEMRRRWWW
jgi:hypothetical protein